MHLVDKGEHLKDERSEVRDWWKLSSCSLETFVCWGLGTCFGFLDVFGSNRGENAPPVAVQLSRLIKTTFAIDLVVIQPRWNQDTSTWWYWDAAPNGWLEYKVLCIASGNGSLDTKEATLLYTQVSPYTCILCQKPVITVLPVGSSRVRYSFQEKMELIYLLHFASQKIEPNCGSAT